MRLVKDSNQLLLPRAVPGLRSFKASTGTTKSTLISLALSRKFYESYGTLTCNWRYTPSERFLTISLLNETNEPLLWLPSEPCYHSAVLPTAFAFTALPHVQQQRVSDLSSLKKALAS